MSPQALLFSSDGEASRQLRQALYELEFEVEHCPEIFAAVEKLTGKNFDVIVSDFDEGLEASFLLKTSRELKGNSGAFTLAVTADRDANAAARQVGADLVLNKPIVAEVAKYSLLTSDAFLCSMRNWLQKLQISSQSTRKETASLSGPTGDAFPSTAGTRPLAQGSTTSAGNCNGILRPAGVPVRKSTEPMALWPYFSRPRAKNYYRSGVPVLIAAIAMVFLSVGYVFSEPNRSQAVVTSVATVCQKALARTKSWLETPTNEDKATAEWAQNDDSTQPGLQRSSHVHVTEIHDPSEPLPARPASPPQAVIAQTRREQPQLALVTGAPVIPESLRTPVGLSASEPPAKANSSLLGVLHPVELSEDFSAKLLLERVEPNYPAQAVRAGLQGSVVLCAWIGKDGEIEDVKLIRGSLLLGEAAYHAVKQWRYKPYLLNGQAVEAQTYVTVNFRLP